jgi:dolichol-phosphate mannosyltransferase
LVSGPEVSVVIPAFNEAVGIAGVIREWGDELSRRGITHEIRVYDDGSSDGTAEEIRRAAVGDPTVVAAHHPNRGHGPTILRGFREARGDWVLLVDGDGEAEPAATAALWQQRHADLVIGRRTTRPQTVTRALVSRMARWSTRLLFGSRVHDVNSPCRLMRRERLLALLDVVPSNAFAPNVLLTGLAARAGLRVVEVPVPFRQRRWGRTSLVSWGLWARCARALAETVATALHAGRVTT